MAQQTAEQITKQTQGAMEDYFSWLQNAMSASPWGSTDLNKKLLSYATENVTAVVTFVQKPFGSSTAPPRPYAFGPSSLFE
jgi:hypothetical protein